MALRPVPFPIASGRYEVGPGMRRFSPPGSAGESDAGHFWPDAALGRTLKAKLQAAPAESHLAESSDREGLRSALLETFRLFALEHPQMAEISEDSLSLHHLGLCLTELSAPTARLRRVGPGWPELASLSPLVEERLLRSAGMQRLGDALGLAVQEDLAIVHGDRLEWLHVCLPSGWSPAEKIGRSFAEVHEPVAGSGQLLASQAQIVRAIIHAGPFVRYVWGIHRDGELCHNPRLHASPPWSPERPEEQAWFRVERQTTCGFPERNRALFTIRYWVEPLTETARDPWRRERLASALAGMSEAEMRYKGVMEARDRLVAWLKGRRA